jgi:hypothetical protein
MTIGRKIAALATGRRRWSAWSAAELEYRRNDVSIRDILNTGKTAADGINDLRKSAELRPGSVGPCAVVIDKAAMRARGRVRKKKGEMNDTEKAFASELDMQKLAGEVLWYGFENWTFTLADKTTYTPDFPVLYATGELWAIDVKGTTKTKGGKHKAFSEEDARIKIKVAAELFPLRFGVAYLLPKKAGGAWKIDEV